MRLKIATFNVNGVNGRLTRLLEWLDEARPDVACLQEIKTGDATFPALAIEAAGYRAIWHGQRTHHGVAVLSRIGAPREVRRGVPGDDADGQARYLEADVAGLRIASVYLPNGNPQPGPKFDYKLAWFERLIGHAQTLIGSGVDAVLAGDFNVVPTDVDIYNRWLWRFDAVLQPETRALWNRFMEQGWIDVTRARHPGERIYSFWVNEAAYRRNAGFRMDFLMVTRDVYARVRNEGIDHELRARERPSDHAPVWMDLD